MRARIIFQGLTLFTFGDSTNRNQHPGPHAGMLTAWLVSDPAHAMMALHKHTPRLGVIGRRDGPAGPRVAPRAACQPGRPEQPPAAYSLGSRLQVAVTGLATGVFVEQSFLDYVPRLSALYGSLPPRRDKLRETLENSKYVTCRIDIPAGTIRAREFISWDWRGNIPAKVAYMDTDFQGFGANEVVVEIGSASTPPLTTPKEPSRSRRLTGRSGSRVWPYSKVKEYDNDIEPNTVELSIGNTAPRRDHPVIWGKHFPAVFQAAGFPTRLAYSRLTQFTEFRAAVEAMGYLPDWNDDSHDPDPFLPFPFLMNIDPATQRLRQITNAFGPGHLTVPLPPPGHDPDNTQICPFGRE